ncbi:WW domain binding protein 1-like [Liolophura sinensis]|uniref:WW domain binding protein 1-like n=1 Tax=Liolophura sinensis TaxID=3198878 RepID=UPI00315909E1
MFCDIGRAVRGVAAILFFCFTQVSGELCKEYGHYCNAPSRCCGSDCCTDQDYDASMIRYYRWNLWNMWYFWFIIVFILMSCFGGCGYYKRRQMLFARQRASGLSLAPPPRSTHRNSRTPVSVAMPIYPHAYAYSGPGADPGAYFMAPPPYSEVVSQPDLYPVNKSELPPYPGDDAPPPAAPDANTATNNHLSSSQTASVPTTQVSEVMTNSNSSPVPANLEVDHQCSAPSQGAAGVERARGGGTVTGCPDHTSGRTNQAY